MTKSSSLRSMMSRGSNVEDLGGAVGGGAMVYALSGGAGVVF
jgi:hypothetical protein